MPREHRHEQRRAEAAEPVETPAAPAPATTRLRAGGTIPPVAADATAAPAPSASDRAFGRAMEFILPHEEVFARGHQGDENHVVAEHVKGDNGGTTKYGIDQASHPEVDVENLTKDQALEVYRAEWDRMHIDGLPEQVAITLFDVRVNGGDPVRWLQQAISALQPADAPPIRADGKLGPATVAAANAVDPAALAQAVIAQREGYYDRLVNSNPAKYGRFSDGWHNRNHDLGEHVAETSRTTK